MIIKQRGAWTLGGEDTQLAMLIREWLNFVCRVPRHAGESPA